MIRLAGAADAAGMVAIWNPVIRDTTIIFNSVERTEPEVAALIAARAAEGHATFVAEAPDGSLAGFATYAQFRGGNGYARTMEHTVMIGPAGRGGGTGRALMAAVTDHARAAGAHLMIAGVSAENAAGIAFHRAIGFRDMAVLPQVGWKFGRFLDLQLMALTLA